MMILERNFSIITKPLSLVLIRAGLRTRYSTVPFDGKAPAIGLIYTKKIGMVIVAKTSAIGRQRKLDHVGFLVGRILPAITGMKIHVFDLYIIYVVHNGLRIFWRTMRIIYNKYTKI